VIQNNSSEPQIISVSYVTRLMQSQGWQAELLTRSFSQQIPANCGKDWYFIGSTEHQTSEEKNWY
jgi:hypothetical protein